MLLIGDRAHGGPRNICLSSDHLSVLCKLFSIIQIFIRLYTRPILTALQKLIISLTRFNLHTENRKELAATLNPPLLATFGIFSIDI